MTELDNLPHLLGQIAKMREEAGKNLPADHRFNIFQVLRPEHDEVQLHSRFIGELLNPKGKHGMKAAFLESFAAQCGFEKHISPVTLNFNKTRVRREYQNIDLLIDDGTHFVVIENKIYASDQPTQLERYAETALVESRQPNLDNAGRPTVYYLTLYGHDATIESLGKLDKLPSKFVQNISYQDDIIPWLDDCIAKSARLPSLRETLIQYQKLAQKLTGTAPEEMKQQLINLLEQGHNGPDAALIFNNWHHVRHHIEFGFWTELEKMVATRYGVSQNAKFSTDRIHRTINISRNRDTGYGIRATVGTIGGHPVQLKINRGGGRLNYGLPRLKDATPETNSDALNKAQQLLDGIFTEFKKPDFWLVVKSSQRNINFELFTDEETTQLINKVTRQEAVEALWKEVETLVDEAILKIEAAHPSEFVRHRVS